MKFPRLPRLLPAVIALASVACSSTADRGDPCQPDDADGVMGGEPRTFQVTVDDEGFTPKVFSAQNRASVTVTLTNEGTRPHGFTIECVQSPAEEGCRTEWCFPAASTIPPVEPGETASADFEVPLYEDFYPVKSGADGDEFEAQFIVQ